MNALAIADAKRREKLFRDRAILDVRRRDAHEHTANFWAEVTTLLEDGVAWDDAHRLGRVGSRVRGLDELREMFAPGLAKDVDDANALSLHGQGRQLSWTDPHNWGPEHKAMLRMLSGGNGDEQYEVRQVSRLRQRSPAWAEMAPV